MPSIKIKARPGTQRAEIYSILNMIREDRRKAGEQFISPIIDDLRPYFPEVPDSTLRFELQEWRKSVRQYDIDWTRRVKNDPTAAHCKPKGQKGIEKGPRLVVDPPKPTYEHLVAEAMVQLKADMERAQARYLTAIEAAEKAR